MTCTVTACPGGTGPDAVRARVWAVRPSASKAIGIERSGSPGSLLPIVIAPEAPSLVWRRAGRGGVCARGRGSPEAGGIGEGGGGGAGGGGVVAPPRPPPPAPARRGD